jgi:tight adherence protein C
MNTVLLILGLAIVVLIALRLLYSRPRSNRPPTSPKEAAELTGSFPGRAGRLRLRFSAALFYFAPWLARAAAPSDAATIELLGRPSTRPLETSAKRLLLAGVPGGLRPNEWLGIRYLTGNVGAGVGAIIGVLRLALSSQPITAGGLFAVLLLAVFGALLGYTIPDFWLGRKIRARQRAIVRMLPEMLDLLTISIQAGLGLDAALSRVVERLKGPLPDEFRRALLEIRLGKTRREALRNIISRTDSKPLINFISGIIQAEQLGVPISRVLTLQSEQLRVEHRQRVEEQASQASIKMIFPMIGCILPAIWVIILGPLAIMLMLGWPASVLK